MTLRRYAPLALAALAAACQPSIEKRGNPPSIDFVAFDLSREIDGVNVIIPQPNDVTLANVATLPVSAQRELLEKFVAAGGFPSDQEVGITIDFSRQLIEGKATKKIFTATTIDTATVTASTVAIFQVADKNGPLATPVLVPFDTTATTFTAGTGRGTLALHRPKNVSSGSRAWDPKSRYVVFVRGGPSGVKVTGGGEVQAWPTMEVLVSTAATGRSLLDPANQGLLPGTAAQKAAAGAQLEPLRVGFAQVLPLLGALGWSTAEVAGIQTFTTAPSPGTVVTVDSGSGIAPLPFDLLREAIPTDTTKPLDGGLIKPNPAFGSAGAGLVTLDGFSTTAMILAQTSGPITAASVPGNVKVYKRTCTGTPPVCTWSQVAAVVTQPPQIQQGGFSIAIGIQPAVWTGTLALPPLAENTKYAVVVTDGVTDATGMASLARSTFAKLILEMTQPVVAPWPVTAGTNPATLTSLLAGIDAQTAAGIQKMRGEIDELIADRSLTRSSIVAAYTFKTQTVTTTSVSLSAAPYGFETTAGAALFTPGTVNAIPADTVCGLIGQPSGCFPTVFPNVANFYTTTIDSPNGLDYVSGFLAVPQSLWMSPGVKNTLQVLVAAPTTPAVTGLAPLVVFHHGITRTRMDMLAIANTLAGKGFVVAAIDAPYHGSRSFCKQDADCTAGTCTPIPPGTSLLTVPGTCTGGTLKPSASGNYFVSGNFFRTRDAIRQDLMDQSSLVLAVARPPPAAWTPQPSSNPLAAALAGIGAGYAVDPTKVYFAGQSLGGILGTEMLATNPRFGRGVINVAGGTLTDIFTQAPDFQAEVDALFLSMGIDRSKIGTDPAVAAAYLKTVNVAKWILDPADPVNFGAYVVPGLPSSIDALATGLGVTQTDVFGMAAYGDTTIPNAFNWELYGLAGTTRFNQATYFAAGSTNSTPLAVPHGFLLANGTNFAAVARAQSDAADFLSTLALPANDLTVTGVPGTQVLLP